MEEENTLLRKIDPTKNDKESTFRGNKNIGLGEKTFGRSDSAGKTTGRSQQFR